MPYLPWDRIIELQTGALPGSAGDLNYALTKVCLEFFDRSEGRYSDYATVVGALECAKLEFYRRAVAKYEDEAILKNGDVYGY